MKYLILSFLLLCSLSQTIWAQLAPKREFRGAWIQTVYQGEYAQMSVDELKRTLKTRLDKLKECGINAILFQVRPESDAWYRSSYEPWSRYITGRQGVAPRGGFDPMAYIIELCRERNMEFHAWINPYRAATVSTSQLAPNHPYNSNPEWFLRFGNLLLFDPGNPNSRAHIVKVVKEMVANYDIDAIHLDDYFYPYPKAGAHFNDNASFARWGHKFSNRNDWRRNNVNELMEQLHSEIHKLKPWVKLGLSPFGIYRNQRNWNEGSRTNGLQNYDDLYADVLLWVQKGWIDYIIPQIYWEIGHTAADYKELVQWWSRHCQDIPLFIGQDVNRTMKVHQLTSKMRLAHNGIADGNCFWPANELLKNNGGIIDSLETHYHRYPALIPHFDKLSKCRPYRVKRLKVNSDQQGYTLSWLGNQGKKVGKSSRYFVVYRFADGEKVDFDRTDRIIAVTPFTSCKIDISELNSSKYYYYVTSVNRYHNESKGRRLVVKLKR